ncbi:nucleotide pyrophosphohydrolase [Aurantivibrio infirmus]
MTKEQILQSFYKIADAKDWHSNHSTKNLASSISVEAAELLALFMWDDTPKQISQKHKERISEEISDIYIYLLVLADKLDIDFDKSIEDKVKKNTFRFLGKYEQDL